MELEFLLNEYGEVEFFYKKEHYLISSYHKKTLFRKGSSEYCFYPANENDDPQKFQTFTELLDVKIGNQKLKDILDYIDIMDTF